MDYTIAEIRSQIEFHKEHRWGMKYADACYLRKIKNDKLFFFLYHPVRLWIVAKRNYIFWRLEQKLNKFS